MDSCRTMPSFVELEKISIVMADGRKASIASVNIEIDKHLDTGRPQWRAKGRVEAENFFLDALSAWHKELNLGKVVLMGHSLGGYLAATYALRHPEDVEHLILVCPAGMVSPAHTSCLLFDPYHSLYAHS